MTYYELIQNESIKCKSFKDLAIPLCYHTNKIIENNSDNINVLNNFTNIKVIDDNFFNELINRSTMTSKIKKYTRKNKKKQKEKQKEKQKVKKTRQKKK